MSTIALSPIFPARRRILPTLASLARVAVGVVLLVAAGAKLSDVDAEGGTFSHGVPLFASTIAAHHVLPNTLAMPAAWVVLILETVIGLWLLSHRQVRSAALAAVLLMLIFSTYLVLARIKSGNATCGCFGRVTRHDLMFSLARNGILVAMILPSLVVPQRRVSPLASS